MSTNGNSIVLGSALGRQINSNWDKPRVMGYVVLGEWIGKSRVGKGHWLKAKVLIDKVLIYSFARQGISGISAACLTGSYQEKGS